MDADTTHTTDMLRRTLALAIESKAAMLSGFPRQLATSLSQKIAIPLMYFIVLSWAPLWWLHRSRKLLASVAIGQFLLFPVDVYWRMGGHAAVKSRIIEDVWLGVEVSRHGGRHLAVDLSPVVSCHMYDDLGATWEGFVKWTYSVSALSTTALIGLVLVGYMSFLAPFYWLWKEVFVLTSPPIWGPLVIFQVAVLFIMRWLIDSRFKESPVSALLHPLGMTFLVAAALYGMARQVAGVGVSWKKRVYGKASNIE